ncbi:MAG: MFS transporter [Gammaproteobacteria bacterium]|nr:MFS transporter [Gammaproteobacteria bacterium]
MKTIANCRWYVVALLFTATAISYIDRQNLAVIAPMLRDELGISNSGYAQILTSFLLAYTVMQAFTGWLIDKLGTRNGFALIMLWWSVAAMLHAFGDSVVSFSIYRFLLGAGEAGSWAACVKAVSEWFPKKERGIANALWGVGTSAGLVISVPIVAWLALVLGWQYSFVATGLSGFVWLFIWMRFYRLPEEHLAISARELKHIQDGQGLDPENKQLKIPFFSLLKSRNVWAVILARVLADPCSWFYHFWIPEFLKTTAGFSVADIGKYAWIPFLTQGIGILLGGLLSDWLYRRGMKIISARFTVMFVGMLCMCCGLLAAFEFNIVIVFFAISTATFGFGLWAPNMMTLCGEAFPRHVVGSVTGLSGMGAGFGGMAFTLLTGWTLDNFGYSPVLMAAGIIPILAVLVLYFLFDRRLAEDISNGRQSSLFPG